MHHIREPCKAAAWPQSVSNEELALRAGHWVTWMTHVFSDLRKSGVSA